MIYIKLDTRFVAPPPSFTLCSKRPLRQYWIISLKCYSDWCWGSIQNALTPLRCVSRKIRQNNWWLTYYVTGISMIGLLRE